MGLSLTEQTVGTDLEGVLIINKPGGWTSHDVVAKVRKMLGVRKVGHTGTLDPSATGVLVLCLGRATRIAEYLVLADKAYRAMLRLGVATDTQDADGAALAYHENVRPDYLDLFNQLGASMPAAAQELGTIVSGQMTSKYADMLIVTDNTDQTRSGHPLRVTLGADGVWRISEM